MSLDKEGQFILKNKINLSQIDINSLKTLPESDLCLQHGDYILQFDFEDEEEEEEKYKIEPGTFLITDTSNGIVLNKLPLKERNLLENVDNTSRIINEAKTFFKKLHVYEKLNRPKKRGVLLYSKPGMGKTSAIERVCKKLIDEDAGTVVMVWPTSEIEADTVVRFLTVKSEYDSKCTRLVLIMEDIGGGEREGSHSPNSVDSGLLNLLDGIGMVFSLPTFIIATTNHPENLLQSLADRPGRFDLMLQLPPPSLDERISLLEFISKRSISEAEKAALSLKGVENFSIAHLEEIAVRAELHDKTYEEVIKELLEHSAKFKRDFEDKDKTMGIGFN